MSNTITLKKSAVSGNVPSSSDLSLGEIAINYADGHLYYKSGASSTPAIINAKDADTLDGSHASAFLLKTGGDIVGNVDIDGEFSIDGTHKATFGQGHYITGRSSSLDIVAFDNSAKLNLVMVGNAGGKSINFITSTSSPSSGATTVGSIDDSGNATFAGDVLAEDNLYLTDAGTVRGKIQLNSSDRDNLDIKAVSLGSLMRFYTANTLALTLDASQNATFAGTISSGAITSSGKITGTELEGTSLDINGSANINSGTVNTVAIFESTDDKAFIRIKDDTTDTFLISKDGSFSIGESSADIDNFKINISSGNTNIAGTVTATSFHGDGSNLTGLSSSTDNTKLPLAGGNMTGHILLNNGIELRSKDTSSNIKTITRVNSNNELEYGWSGGGPVKFMGGGSYTERMRIHTDGNVGIGTTSPSAKLTVQGDNADFMVRSNDYTISRIIPRGDTSANWDKGLFSLFNASTEAVRIDSASNSWFNGGQVGIGTTSPDSKLHVELANAALGFDQGITIQSNPSDFTAGRGGGIIMKNADVTTAGIFGIRQANNYEGALLFYTHTVGIGNTFDTTFTEKMRISSNGNVGIGTTSPSRGNLVVKGDFQTIASGNGQVAVISKVSGSNEAAKDVGGQMVFGGPISASDSNRTFGLVGGYKENNTSGDRAGYLTFGTRQNAGSRDIFERMRIDSIGNVGIGTISPVALSLIHI